MWEENPSVSKRAISVPVSPHVAIKGWLVNHTCGFSTPGIQRGSGLVGCQTQRACVDNLRWKGDKRLNTLKLRSHRNNWENETNQKSLNSRWIIMFIEETGSWSQLSKIVTQVCFASSALRHIQPGVTGMWVDEKKKREWRIWKRVNRKKKWHMKLKIITISYKGKLQHTKLRKQNKNNGRESWAKSKPAALLDPRCERVKVLLVCMRRPWARVNSMTISFVTSGKLRLSSTHNSTRQLSTSSATLQLSHFFFW